MCCYAFVTVLPRYACTCAQRNRPPANPKTGVRCRRRERQISLTVPTFTNNSTLSKAYACHRPCIVVIILRSDDCLLIVCHCNCTCCRPVTYVLIAATRSITSVHTVRHCRSAFTACTCTHVVAANHIHCTATDNTAQRLQTLLLSLLRRQTITQNTAVQERYCVFTTCTAAIASNYKQL